MDIKVLWVVVAISSISECYENEQCERVVINAVKYVFSSCRHDERSSTFNCTDLKFEILESSDLPENGKVQILILSKCCLQTVYGDAFNKMRSLLQLDLSYNSLQILNYKLFKETKLLNDLNLRFNKLESLDYRVFTSVVRLKHLDLSHNFLRTIDHRLLEHQEELVYINLECNTLFTLHDVRMFTSQGQLQQLLIANNSITTIDVNVLNPLTSIKKLTLGGNPLVCQCHLQLAVNWTLSKTLETNAICAYPPDLEGKSWIHVNTSPGCERNVSLESCAAEEASYEEDALRRANMILIIVLGCVGIILVIICVVFFIYCWKNCRKSSLSTEELVKPRSVELTEDRFYESVQNSQQKNVTNFSNCSSLPETSTYDYVDPAAFRENENTTRFIQDRDVACGEDANINLNEYSQLEKNEENAFYQKQIL